MKEDREYHINNKVFINGIEVKFGHDHPMCRCTIMIQIKEIWFTPCTEYLIQEYKEECKESVIWVN